MRRFSAILAGLVLAASLFPVTSALAFPDNLLTHLLSFQARCIKQNGTFKQTKPMVFQCLAPPSQETCDYNGIVHCKSSGPAKTPAKPN